MTKAQPLEYPRNVPDIDLDEDVILPGTIVVESKRQEYIDPEEETRQRAAKRRRIEAHAHAYLRGEQLSILSASLRGPFDKGWKNPWKPKPHSVQQARSKSMNNSRVRQPQPLVEQPRNVRPTTVVTELNHVFQADSSISIKASSPFDDLHQDTRQQTPDTKVHAWLKTSNAYSSTKMRPPIYSPTSDRHRHGSPQVRQRKIPRVKRPWTPTKQVVEPASQLGRVPPHQSPRHDDAVRNAASFTQTQTSTAVGVHDRLQKILDWSDAPATVVKVITPSSPGHEENTVDVGVRDGEQGWKRNAEHFAPEGACSSTTKHRKRNHVKKEDEDVLVLVPSSPPPELAVTQRATSPSEVRPPAALISPKSDTSSKLMVRQILASAKKAPSDFLETSFKQLESKVKQCSSPIPVAEPTAESFNGLFRCVVPPISVAVTSASDMPSTDLPASAQMQKPELQAEASAFNDSVGALKELKAITRNNTSAEESVPTMNGADEITKHQQAPIDSPPAKLKRFQSSDGSMKNAFRMTKRVTLPAPVPTPKLKTARLKSPPPLTSTHSSDVDMQDTEHDASSNKVYYSLDDGHPRRVPKAAPQNQVLKRGILKPCPSTTTSAAALLRKDSTVSSKRLPSGQHNHLRNQEDLANFDAAMVEDMDEEDFDLNGAIDELGSFLSFNIDREFVSG